VTSKTIFKRLLLYAAAVVTIALVCVIVDFSAFRGRTPRIDTPEGISSLETMRIGGVDQWVLIRGRDRTKPVLLFLHGGPGMPAMFLAHAFQTDLERDFVVVQWDRRGAGKSFDALQDGSPPSVSKTLADTYELTRNLSERFGQRRIYLVGHSWGSYLGLLAVRDRPEYYSAYVGVGQLAANREQVHASRQASMSRIATATKDPELLARLPLLNTQMNEDDLFLFGGELHAGRSFLPILMTGLLAPEYTFRDALNVKRGADRVLRQMQYDVVPKPLEGEISKVSVPVFFFIGRHDLNTPSQLAAEYLDRLEAPLKAVVWFEQSAHFPFYEEPERFDQEMVRVEQATSDFWKPGSSVGDSQGLPKSM
jgi:pimeloyl-ACP methyl ester carboxylesterase